MVCCGETLIDMLPEERAGRTTTFHGHCGDADDNTVVVLGRLGVPVSRLTGLPDDPFGRMREAGLGASLLGWTWWPELRRRRCLNSSASSAPMRATASMTKARPCG